MASRAYISQTFAYSTTSDYRNIITHRRSEMLHLVNKVLFNDLRHRFPTCFRSSLSARKDAPTASVEQPRHILFAFFHSQLLLRFSQRPLHEVWSIRSSFARGRRASLLACAAITRHNRVRLCVSLKCLNTLGPCTLRNS